MNLSESVRYVLRHNSQLLLSDFWKEDVKSILINFKGDLFQFIKSAPKKPTTFKQFKDGSLEAYHVITKFPGRIKHGFTLFKEDFLLELETIEDPKEKTIFCLKVISFLTSFAVSTVYDIKKGRNIQRTPIGQFLLNEILLNLSKLFITRFIGEIERQLSDDDDLKKLRFFRQILTGQAAPTGVDEYEEDPQDKAFQLVGAFKNYIMTGKES